MVAGIVALCALLIAMASKPPPERWLWVPHESVCLDLVAGTPDNGAFVPSWPHLMAFSGRTDLGPVPAGSCVRLNGVTATSAIWLSCPVLRSARAVEWSANPQAMNWPAVKANCASGALPVLDLR